MAKLNRWGAHRRKNFAGESFGFLVALKDVGTTGAKRLWRFRCTCGKEIVRIPRKCLSSCGCKTKGLQSRPKSHGMSYHPAYWVWRSMVDRCRLPTHQAWKNYGGRGIRVCRRWQYSFENFWIDMGPTYKKGLTIERTNNNKGYNSGNCIWATSKHNNWNKRNTVLINGLPVKEVARVNKIGHTTLVWRMEHWPKRRWFEPVGPQGP